MAALRLSIFLILFIGLRIHPARGAVPRLGAFDDATLLPFSAGAGGFAPRWYDTEGTPARRAQPVSPNPRHVLDGHRLGARQSNPCGPGQHSCVEAQDPGFCCSNEQYCYLNSTWHPNCCSLGVNCRDSVCDHNELYCNSTSSTTVAISTASSSAGKDQSAGVTAIVSVSTIAACCNRACGASSYSCERAFGGQCCPYGFKCGINSGCILDPAPPTSTSVSTIVGVIPPGCTATSQFLCSEGGGCCDTGSICTFQSVATATSKPVCAPDPALSNDSSSALSSSARAGIGVGVAVAAAIVISAVTWLCIRRRRQRFAAAGGTSASAHEMRHNAAGGRQPARGVDQDQGDSLLVGPHTPWTPRSGFSDANGVLPSNDHLYLGPDAMVGPFTDRDGDGHAYYGSSPATTPPAATGDGAPYHPDHIVRPIEIDTGEAHKGMNGVEERVHPVETEEAPAQHEGLFELMGSPGVTSPLNPDESGQAADKGPSSPGGKMELK